MEGKVWERDKEENWGSELPCLSLLVVLFANPREGEVEYMLVGFNLVRYPRGFVS